MSFSKNHWLTLFLRLVKKHSIKVVAFTLLIWTTAYNYEYFKFRFKTIEEFELRPFIMEFKPVPFRLPTTLPFVDAVQYTNGNALVSIDTNYVCILKNERGAAYKSNRYTLMFPNFYGQKLLYLSDFRDEILNIQSSSANYYIPSDVKIFSGNRKNKRISEYIVAKCWMYPDVSDGIIVSNEFGSAVISWRPSCNEIYMDVVSKNQKNGFRIVLKDNGCKDICVDDAKTQLLNLWNSIRWLESGEKGPVDDPSR